MARSRELRVVISGDPSQLSRAFAKAEGAATRFGGKVESVGSRVGGAFSLLGRAGVASAGLGFGAMLRAGVDYEKQMARVQGVTNATGEQMKSLGGLAKDLGARTKFSAGEAATAMYELGSAGFTVDKMAKVLPGTLALASASNIELKDAAEISANALNGFGLSSDKMGHVADVLAQTTNRTSVEMRDLQLSMKYIGPVARTTGQDFETMLAAVGEMGNVGIKGEQAGTTLRGALVRLTRPTKSVLEGFDQLGIKAGELNGPKGLKPLPEIIGILEDKTKGMDKATRNAALANIFGTEALSGMAALVDQGSGALEKNAEANRKSEGAAKKAADTMNDTVAGAWENFTGSIETAAISLYETFAPALKDALGGAAGFVNDLSKLPGKIKHEFEALKSTRGGPGAAIGAMLQNAFDDVDWKAIGTKISAGLKGAFKLSSDVSGQVSEGLQAAFSDIDTRKVGATLAGVLVEAFATITDPGFWAHHLGALFAAVTFVIPLGKILKIPGFGFLFNLLSRNLFRAARAVMEALGRLLGRAGSQAFTSFLAEIEKAFPRVANAMLKIATGGAGALRSFPGRVAGWASRAVGALIDKLGDAVGRAAGVMTRLVTGGVARLVGGVGRFAAAAGRIVAGIAGRFDDLVGNVPSKIAKALAAGTARIASWVGNFGSAALEIGKKIVSSIVSGMGNLGHAILNKIKSSGSWVKSQLGKAGGAVGGFFGIGEGIGKSVTDQVQAQPPGLGAGTIPGGGLSAGGLQGADSALGGLAAVGARFGLHVSSGLRPGSITSSNNVSYHSTGEAIDLANGRGPDPQKLSAFRYLKSHFGGKLAELIYTPGGVGVKNGQPYRYGGQVAADHLDHVHVALDLGRPGVGIGDGIGRRLFTGDGPGRYGPQQLANLWVRAGGKRSVAGLMARVALAESGGVPTARNPSGASGLWQILGAPFRGNVFDPLTNARMAVWKYDHQGLGAWAASRAAWGKYVGKSGITVGQGVDRLAGSTTSGLSQTEQDHRQRLASQREADRGVGSYDYAIAGSDVEIAEATGGRVRRGAGGRVISSPALAETQAQTRRLGIVNRRIAKVRAGLRGARRRSTKLRLRQELATLLNERSTISGRITELGALPESDASVATTADGGTGAAADGGETDAERAAREAQEANTAALQAAAEAFAAHQQELAGVRAEIKRQTDIHERVQSTETFQLKKYLADVMSGFVGGYGVAPRAYTPGVGSVARY